MDADLGCYLRFEAANYDSVANLPKLQQSTTYGVNCIDLSEHSGLASRFGHEATKNMKSLRILLADDHDIVRRGLVAILRSRAGWDVCAEAETGRQAVEKARELKPDIAILDIGMPELNGLDATRQIVLADKNIKVLILTISDSDNLVRAVLEAGARGFLLKSDAALELINAVEALHADRTFFTSRVSDVMLSGFRDGGRARTTETSIPTLTAREREVVQLLAEGKSTKEVAYLLGVGVKTADTHRTNVMRKLGLHSVSALVLYAVRNGMIQVTPTLTPQ